MTVSSVRVPTSEASPKTVQRRVDNIREARESLGVCLEEEVRALSRESRQELLIETALPIEIPPEHTLAMKANLSISWNKLRTL